MKRLLLAAFWFGLFFGVGHAYAYPLNEHLIGRAGKVELYEFANLHDGGKGYFLKALPAKGSPPYPVLVLVNPYAVFPEDREWTAWIQKPPYYDRSLPAAAKIFKCQTPGGECTIFVEGVPDISDVASLGDVFGEGKTNSIAGWALANGYAVIIAFARHYKARDIVTVIYDIAETIWVAKTSPLMAPTIDGERIAALGQSQGGQLVIYSLALLGSAVGRSSSIKSAVTVGAWADGPAMYKYYAEYLPQVQSGRLLAESQALAIPYLHRIARSFGRDVTSPAWSHITISYVAAR